MFPSFSDRHFHISLAGLLNSFFEILYDNDVLSAEAYEKWKEDPEEDGKGEHYLFW